MRGGWRKRACNQRVTAEPALTSSPMVNRCDSPEWDSDTITNTLWHNNNKTNKTKRDVYIYLDGIASVGGIIDANDTALHYDVCLCHCTATWASIALPVLGAGCLTETFALLLYRSFVAPGKCPLHWGRLRPSSRQHAPFLLISAGIQKLFENVGEHQSSALLHTLCFFACWIYLVLARTILRIERSKGTMTAAIGLVFTLLVRCATSDVSSCTTTALAADKKMQVRPASLLILLINLFLSTTKSSQECTVVQ